MDFEVSNKFSFHFPDMLTHREEKFSVYKEAKIIYSTTYKSIHNLLIFLTRGLM